MPLKDRQAPSPSEIDQHFMGLALAEAMAAGLRQEVPIGAVLVDAEGVVLAQEGNRTIELSDPTAHAEILVLRAGGQRLGNYRLTGATLFVTLEPCLMCMGAMIHARLSRLVFASLDPKAGAAISRYQVGRDQQLNHTLIIEQGPLSGQCSDLLRSFFQARREGGKSRTGVNA